MCLIVREGGKIEIAKKDITTYKKVRILNNRWWSGIFYKENIFRFNKLEKTVINLRIYYGEINEGFHSFKRLRYNYITSGKLVICIIPKGSEYCLGNGDIVSN